MPFAGGNSTSPNKFPPFLSDSTCAINCEDPELSFDDAGHRRRNHHEGVHHPRANGYQERDNLLLNIVFHGFVAGCVLHGRRNGGLNDLRDAVINFFVAYPQAAYRPHRRKTPIGSQASTVASIYLDDIFFSEQLIEHIDEEFSLDLSRVYAAGYSNEECSRSLACLRGVICSRVFV